MTHDQQKAVAAYEAMTAAALRDDVPVRFNPDAEAILADMRARMYANPEQHFPDVAAARAMAEYLAATRIGAPPVDREALRVASDEEVNLMALPVDNPDRNKLRDVVRLKPETLATRARKYLTLSAVYAERDADAKRKADEAKTTPHKAWASSHGITGKDWARYQVKVRGMYQCAADDWRAPDNFGHGAES